jgi:polyhydroxyalkanoate synthesis regulator phasin
MNKTIEEILDLINFTTEEYKDITEEIFNRIENQSPDIETKGENFSRADQISLIFNDTEDCEMHAYDLGRRDAMLEVRRRLSIIMEKINNENNSLW